MPYFEGVRRQSGVGFVRLLTYEAIAASSEGDGHWMMTGTNACWFVSVLRAGVNTGNAGDFVIPRIEYQLTPTMPWRHLANLGQFFAVAMPAVPDFSMVATHRYSAQWQGIGYFRDILMDDVTITSAIAVTANKFNRVAGPGSARVRGTAAIGNVSGLVSFSGDIYMFVGGGGGSRAARRKAWRNAGPKQAV